MIILAFIPATRAVNPATSALPLIFVLTTSAIKDAVEDYKRRRTDKEVNQSITTLIEPAVSHSHSHSNNNTSTTSTTSTYPVPLSPQELEFAHANSSFFSNLDFKLESLGNTLSQKIFNKKEGSFLTAAVVDEHEKSQRHLPPIENHTRRVLWQDLHVGDIVKLYDGDAIPADLLLLSSSDPLGVCYVDTASMDGETNLKTKDAFSATKSVCTSPETCSTLQCQVKYEAPSNNLFRFEGSVSLSSDNYSFSLPISASNLLLRSCVLRNTEYVYGLVLYAGHETKVYKNNSTSRFKRTKMEKMMNSEILIVFFVLILFSTISAVLSSVPGTSPSQSHWYLSFPYSAALNGFISFWSFVLILQSMVPISLYVTVELVKLVQGKS